MKEITKKEFFDNVTQKIALVRQGKSKNIKFSYSEGFDKPMQKILDDNEWKKFVYELNDLLQKNEIKKVAFLKTDAMWINLFLQCNAISLLGLYQLSADCTKKIIFHHELQGLLLQNFTPEAMRNLDLSPCKAFAVLGIDTLSEDAVKELNPKMKKMQITDFQVHELSLQAIKALDFGDVKIGALCMPTLTKDEQSILRKKLIHSKAFRSFSSTPPRISFSLVPKDNEEIHPRSLPPYPQLLTKQKF